ncbi:MAG: bifunctional UDP-sugar hydrolase/5'-nucleotidase [Tenericutes bacterium]|jgi:5'-nucleotidase/UDP-sugar diphosphatase|nr:bifunctional UDP-sugar hydrolase/5'-nucleotidase [Mycoplasmatota bacterium]
MKKLLSILVVLSLSLGFFGCNNFVEITTEPQTTVEITTEISSTNVPTTEVTTVEPTTSLSTTEETTVEPTTEVTTTEVNTTIEPTTEDEFVTINLFSINDFHGGAYTDISLISGIGAYINSVQGHKIAVSNGDIFQGTAISNYYHGEILVDILNEAGFKGFVIGNHEFDWGLDAIENYNDGDETNGEFNQPILAANIVYEDTLEPLDFTQPYFIEEFEGVRIGVIGMMGQLSNSIAASRTENIIFLDPVLTAAKYAKELREEQDVDVVVLYIHDSSWNNDEFAALSGSERIDAMFNGHSHQDEGTEIYRGGLPMPYAQMNNFDTSLVRIQLTYDLNLDMLTDYSISEISTILLESINDNQIDLVIEEYATNLDYVNFIGEVLTTSEGDFYRGDLSEWGASVIRDYAGVDIGATNSGGFRVSMEAGELTMGELITIYPFDNIIKTSEMTGQQIQNFYIEIMNGGGDIVFDDGLFYNYSTNRLEINGNPIVLNQTYTVGAVDYIFDKTDYDFIEGQNITQTIYFMRDLLADDLRNETDLFNPYDGSNYPE